jgi:hypothetical protein
MSSSYDRCNSRGTLGFRYCKISSGRYLAYTVQHDGSQDHTGYLVDPVQKNDQLTTFTMISDVHDRREATIS